MVWASRINRRTPRGVLADSSYSEDPRALRPASGPGRSLWRMLLWSTCVSTVPSPSLYWPGSPTAGHCSRPEDHRLFLSLSSPLLAFFLFFIAESLSQTLLRHQPFPSLPSLPIFWKVPLLATCKFPFLGLDLPWLFIPARPLIFTFCQLTTHIYH